MNTTELYIAAGKAIGEWGKKNNAACFLEQADGIVICRALTKNDHFPPGPLFVSQFEIKQGMKQPRWTSIGEALHELYCKEITCQAHQKH